MALTATRHERDGRRSFGRGLVWRRRLNLLAVLALSFYNVLVINILLVRHPWRVDLTEEGIHTLTDESLEKLDLIQEEIRLIVPYAPPNHPLAQAHIQTLERARTLIDEFMARQPLIRVIADINVFAQADRWNSLCEEYHLSKEQWNRIYLCAGEGNAYRQAVTPQDLAVFGAARSVEAPPPIEEFRGEKVLIDALMRLIHRQRKLVYFTQDNGEPALEGRADQPVSLAALRHDLESSGFEARALEISSVRRIPLDCELLVIAGPEQKFTASELAMVDRYLLEDGRLLVTLGAARSGIESVLERWGVRVLPDRVHMRGATAGTRFDTAWVSPALFHEQHAITQVFKNAPRFDMRFWEPRPLKTAGAEKRLLSEALLGTGTGASGERFFLVGEGLADSPENHVLATATSQEALARPPPDWKQRKTRIVVVGATNFLRDRERNASAQGGYLSFSHRDFFMNCVQWLVGQEERATLGGQASIERTIPMNPERIRFLFLSSVLIFPGIFLALGVFVYLLRKGT